MKLLRRFVFLLSRCQGQTGGRGRREENVARLFIVISI